MMANTSARAVPFAFLIAATLCFVAGCGQASSSDFAPYSQLGKGIETEIAPSTDASTGAGLVSSIEPIDPTSPEPTNAAPKAEENTEPVAANIPEELPANTEGRTPLNNSGVGSGRMPREPKNKQASARKVEVFIKSKEFRTEGHEGAIRVSYDDIDLLKVLNMEPVTPNAPQLMPKWLKELDGKRIRIRGFMFPTYSETGLRGFALARDNQICCFVRKPKIYDVFEVAMRKGKTTDYIPNRPFDLVGVFHIRPEVEDGELFQLYLIDDAITIEK